MSSRLPRSWSFACGGRGLASRDGHTEIVRELLADGADVNATEPTLLVTQVPGVTRYYQSFTRDSWYGISEPPFDAAYHIWFAGQADLESASSRRSRPPLRRTTRSSSTSSTCTPCRSERTGSPARSRADPLFPAPRP